MAGSASIWRAEPISRSRQPKASRGSPRLRHRTVWYARIRAPRWWIWAKEWPAWTGFALQEQRHRGRHRPPVTETLRPESDAVRNFSSFVISGDADNFSVGA